ncbi:MAG: FeoB-associated Cys-rich membrane protein [Rudanella sp.]|nr:FeoB-associated Cys-rich membrane protein [Rudanella sp.]
MQELIVLLLFAVAAAYLGWRGYKSVKQQDAGCGKGCGCKADTTPVKTIKARR